MAPDDETRARQAGRANALVDQGRFAEAMDCLAPMLADGPPDAGLLNALGRAQLGLEQVEAAATSFAEAARLDPAADAPALNHCLALDMLGRTEAAVTAYQAMLAGWPDHREARRRHALLVGRLGRWAEALREMQSLLAEFPDDLGILMDRAFVQLRMDMYAAALRSYDQAVAMAPGNAEAHYNRAVALQQMDRSAEAVADYDAALRIDPAMDSARINRANSLRRLHRHQEAIADYRDVLTREPRNPLALGNLGKTLGEIGEHRAALGWLDKAIEAAPALAEVRWMRANTTIPAVRMAEDDLSASRAEFAAALADYDAWTQAAGDLPAVVNVGRPHPFFLAYQEANNRDLLAAYGTHCARVMARWMTENGIAPARAQAPRAGPLRVGIVSAHVSTHSVWLAIVRGWLQHADRARVAYHLFSLGSAHDPQTDLAGRLAARFEPGPRGLRDWVAAIRAAQPDVLVYPEIGMDDMTMKLAAMRLAPVQVASWGHPETTGLPTIDAYVSAEALEPPGAAAHYTERLVTLPGLGCCYTALPVKPEPPDLPALGLRADAPILLCPGVPFKYVPEHDHVYADIARRAPAAQLVFFRQDVNPLLSDKTFARLQGVARERAGEEAAARMRLIPWRSLTQFYGLMRRADLFLDTIGFSGFNTAMQAIECGLPIVTMEGRFMRGRLASGILRRMEMAEAVAPDPAGYIDIAARVATDAAARNTYRQALSQRRARLFDDVGTVRAFEAFLHDAVRAAAP